MKDVCYLNGSFLPLNEAKISVLDRGFLFGDGVYEVMRIYEGKFFQFETHMQRLARSLDGLRIKADITQISKAAHDLLAQSPLKEATIYMQVSRGAAPKRHHFFPAIDIPATVFMFLTAYDDAPVALMRREGAKAVTVPDLRWGRVDLKTVNLLGNVFAAQAAKEAGVYEAIFVNKNQEVTEGSHTNVFARINGELRTYPLSTSVLPGITRLVVFEAAKKAGIQIIEKPVSCEELFEAEEVFISATTAEVLPIVEIDGKKIGTGHPGELTLRLQTAFKKEIDALKTH